MILQPQFDQLWEDSDESLQNGLKTLIDLADRDGIINWIRNHPSLELGERTLADLKRIARRLGVINYSRKDKLSLIRDIQEKQNV